MKHDKSNKPQNQKPTKKLPLDSDPDMRKSEMTFVPSPDEVSRRAYFSYENQGSHQGNDVQHWLAAEAELIAERNLTRTHGFQKRA